MDLFNKGKVEGLESQLQDALNQIEALSKYGAMSAVDIEREIGSLKAQKLVAENETSETLAKLQEAKKALIETDELAILQEVGIYEYSTLIDTSLEYKEKILELEANIKAANKTGGGAITAVTGWTVNGSEAQGKKMVNEISKLMLRAYNAEAEDAVRTLKPHKVISAMERMGKIKETIEKLGQTMQIRISADYHAMRVKEIRLNGDFLQKLADEKEAQKVEAQRLKDEAKAQKEFEAEKVRLEKEKTHQENLLKKAEETGNQEIIAEAKSKIEDIEKGIAGVEERSANIRAGYVYVISNIGSFGEEVVKVGLTRRIDYEDRIRELSDASVPFIFDTHAVIFSNDAVSLEKQLHNELESLRVNKVNARKEFFRTTPVFVKEILEKLAGEHLLVYNEIAEAAEFRISSK